MSKVNKLLERKRYIYQILPLEWIPSAVRPHKLWGTKVKTLYQCVVYTIGIFYGVIWKVAESHIIDLTNTVSNSAAYAFWVRKACIHKKENHLHTQKIRCKWMRARYLNHLTIPKFSHTIGIEKHTRYHINAYYWTMFIICFIKFLTIKEEM